MILEVHVFLVHLALEDRWKFGGEASWSTFLCQAPHMQGATAIWVGPRRFLPREQLRKQVRPTTVGAFGQDLATGRQELGAVRMFVQCG